MSAAPCLRGFNKKIDEIEAIGGIEIIGEIKITGGIEIIDGATVIKKIKEIIINSLIFN